MKKTIISILIVSLMFFMIAGNSYAAQLEAEIEVSADKTEVSKGDIVTFTLKTKNIANAENDSVSAISGVIEWDKDFFEIPSNGTGSATLNTETGDFNCISIVKDGGTNGTIMLKVKDTASGSGIVSFTDLEASDGRTDEEGTATTSDQEITIKMKSTGNDNSSTDTTDPDDSNDNPSTNDPSTDQETPSNDNNSKQEPDDDQNTTNGTTVIVGGNTDNTIANRNYDKAGINAIIVIATIVVSIISIIIYKKSKEYKDIK